MGSPVGSAPGLGAQSPEGTQPPRRRPQRAVSLIGMGHDGCTGLTSRAINAIARAQVLVGGKRQLGFFPDFRGERLVIERGLDAVIERIVELAEEKTLAVLASGDPLFFGIGARLMVKLGASQVDVVPQPSCMQLAFARIGQSWEDAAFISLHGRALAGVAVQLRNQRKALLLTGGDNTPARIARHLIEYGQLGFQVWLCEDLGGVTERVRALDLATLAMVEDVSPLNVLVLVRTAADFRHPSSLPFLHEDVFAKRMPKRGLITKREVRLLCLAELAVRPDSVIWDIGAGSGSVGIEAALLAPRGHVYAIELDPEGVVLCEENARAHGADNVSVILGRAPDALGALPGPDAVFIGGSKGSLTEIMHAALDRLAPGGRLVVNAVTLENAAEAHQALVARRLTPDVKLVQISRAEPLAHYQRYVALNPIHIFSVEKPAP